MFNKKDLKKKRKEEKLRAEQQSLNKEKIEQISDKPRSRTSSMGAEDKHKTAKKEKSNQSSRKNSDVHSPKHSGS